jgi:hypothetical protein
MPDSHVNLKQPHEASFIFPWWVWVWGLNSLCLGAAYSVKADWTGNKYVRKLAPNWEYTIGNWWSGMLLLSFAVITAMAAFNATTGKPRLRWALSVLSLLALGLSLDEMGSLHERASDIGPLPGDWNFILCALIFVVIATWALWVLWCERKSCGTFWLRVLIGLGCLAVVEPLERIEHIYPWPAALVPASVVLEEGLEMLGSTLLLWAGVVLIRKWSDEGRWRIGDGSAGLVRAGHFIAAATIPLVYLRQYLQVAGTLDLHSRGDFGAVPAVMLFAFAAWACVLRIQTGSRIRFLWGMLAGLSALLSIELSCNLISWITRESVRSPAGVWWVQITAATAGYGLLLLAGRSVTQAKGRSPADAA